jgi:hypothetical protein
VRIAQLKVLAAWTSANWRRLEPQLLPRVPPRRDDEPDPIDIVADSLGRWRAMYEDGSLGPPLTLDEMLDLLPHLAPPPPGWDDELDEAP